MTNEYENNNYNLENEQQSSGVHETPDNSWTNIWDTPAQEMPKAAPSQPAADPVAAAQPQSPETAQTPQQAQHWYAASPRTEQTRNVYTSPVYTAPVDNADAYTPNYCRGGYTYDPAAAQKAAPKQKKEHKGLGKRIASVVVAAAICAGASAASAAIVTDAKLKNAPAAASTGSTSVVVQAAPASSGTESSSTAHVSGSAMSATEIYNSAVDQVVAISITGVTQSYFGQAQYSIAGSGFILSSDGYIMTNYHVISTSLKTGDEIKVMLHDGSEYTATVVGYEQENDLAVLKIDATGLSAVTIGNFDDLQVGEPVYALGNPTGRLAYSISDGIVSAKDRVISTEAARDVNMFQITAAINEGISGGPVYNDRGEVVGVATAKYNDAYAEGLGFAIPIDDAMRIATDLIETGHVTGKAYLGVVVNNLDQSTIQYYNLKPGVGVSAVFEGSAAEKAGIQVGDVITALDGTEVTSVDELTSARRAYRAGDTVEITVYRDGQTLTLSLTFDEQGATSYSTSIPENITNPFAGN